MAGRRTSLASLAGQTVESVPGQSQPLLLSLPLNKLVPTRFNPRRRFGTEDELREFGDKLAREQLQPAVVVSRAAYLKLWPEEAEHVGDASYVIANGERRYRASLLVGRPTLEVVHKEDVASSRAAFLDAVQSENNDRADLDPIERALGIDIMVTQLGGADQVAVYYGKTKGWVSQQRKLLKLTPALQDLVSAGELPIRVARDIAGLPSEVQATAWEEEQARRKAAKEAHDQWTTQGDPALPQPAPPTDRFTAVNREAASSTKTPAPGEETRQRFTAVNHGPPPAPVLTSPPPAPAPSSGGAEARQVPEQQKTEPPGTPVPQQAAEDPPPAKPFPYHDGLFAGQLIEHKMELPEIAKMYEYLGGLLRRHDVTSV